MSSIETNQLALDLAALLKKHNCRAIVAACFTQSGQPEQVINVVRQDIDPVLYSFIRKGVEGVIEFYTGSRTLSTESAHVTIKRDSDEMPH